MRTTITLDPDVEALVKKVMRERGLSFKEAVNGALRAGLQPTAPRPDYAFPTYDLGVPKVDTVHLLRLVAELEGEEIVRETGLGR